MHAQIAFLIADAAVLLASIPLILQRVGPNPIYGFRTPKTMSNPGIWFRANLVAGWALAIAAMVSASAVWLAPADLVEGPAGVAFFLMPLGVALAASIAYVRKLR